MSRLPSAVALSGGGEVRCGAAADVGCRAAASPATAKQSQAAGACGLLRACWCSVLARPASCAVQAALPCVASSEQGFETKYIACFDHAACPAEIADGVRSSAGSCTAGLRLEHCCTAPCSSAAGSDTASGRVSGFGCTAAGVSAAVCCEHSGAPLGTGAGGAVAGGVSGAERWRRAAGQAASPLKACGRCAPASSGCAVSEPRKPSKAPAASGKSAPAASAKSAAMPVSPSGLPVCTSGGSAAMSASSSGLPAGATCSWLCSALSASLGKVLPERLPVATSATLNSRVAEGGSWRAGPAQSLTQLGSVRHAASTCCRSA